MRNYAQKTYFTKSLRGAREIWPQPSIISQKRYSCQAFFIKYFLIYFWKMLAFRLLFWYNTYRKNKGDEKNMKTYTIKECARLLAQNNIDQPKAKYSNNVILSMLDQFDENRLRTWQKPLLRDKVCNNFCARNGKPTENKICYLDNRWRCVSYRKQKPSRKIHQQLDLGRRKARRIERGVGALSPFANQKRGKQTENIKSSWQASNKVV